MEDNHINFNELQIDGELFCDNIHKTIYATDASAYRETPIGVAFPKNNTDIQKLVHFATQNKITLIPRAAGTSLAGQVVGNGLVVDISRHFKEIIEVNQQEKWARVQPAVVLDELNLFCKADGLFFAPETSTANRCQLGGMVGNNSCGSHSLVYGSTREHLLEATVILSDGSEIVLKALTPKEVEEKRKLPTLEGKIYNDIIKLLSDPENQKEVINNFPDPSLTRRNTGYALDELLYTNYFDSNSKTPFNLCKLLAGSEGTLAFITELKVNLEPLPPKNKAVIALHCNSLEESFVANLVALEHQPVAIELIDGKILELSKHNISQNKNRFFIQGDPAAVLIIELAEETTNALNCKASQIIEALQSRKMGYHYPIIYGTDIQKIWNLRKAGLGLLTGMTGDAKPVSVVEDTAVTPQRLPAYMADFKAMMEQYGLKCVYHAHIATGELHLRPVLNLKDKKDIKLFREVATECALLVKKHKGSLSGEHGDGRLRGEFIPLLFGEKVYSFMKEIKNSWDENNIFNKGKIIDTPPMDESLRYRACDFQPKTYFDFSKQGGFLRAVELCNGSGDCLKSELFTGTMCPTYRATKDERFATRARANIMREAFHKGGDIFNNQDVLDLLDNCVSCKACKSECPSNVDMTRFKAEFMQHHYDKHWIPLRTFLVANISNIHLLFSWIPWLYNLVAKNRLFSSILKWVIGFAKERPLPTLYKTTLRRWCKNYHQEIKNKKGEIYLFADEFTNHMDVEVGIAFVKLLNILGYKVLSPKHIDSGRAQMSKGLIKQAIKRANKNVMLLKDIVTDDKPLVGIEPSAILSFRDEYPDLVRQDLKKDALLLAKNALLYDEFFDREIKKGNITPEQFHEAEMKIKLHGHCHQKTLASVELSKEMLSLPKNHSVEIIPSGCCGMAGSYGYEKEHYELSLQIGETTLFPEVRKANNFIISAPGTSCRHQIKDGTGRDAYHPIEIMYQSVIKNNNKNNRIR